MLIGVDIMLSFVFQSSNIFGICFICFLFFVVVWIFWTWWVYIYELGFM